MGSDPVGEHVSNINIYIAYPLLVHCNSCASLCHAKWQCFLNEMFLNEEYSVYCMGTWQSLLNLSFQPFTEKSQSYGCSQGANRGCGTNVIKTGQHLPEFLTYSQKFYSEISYLGYFLLEAAYLVSHVPSALQQYFRELSCTFLSCALLCLFGKKIANNSKLPIF